MCVYITKKTTIINSLLKPFKKIGWILQPFHTTWRTLKIINFVITGLPAINKAFIIKIKEIRTST